MNIFAFNKPKLIISFVLLFILFGTNKSIAGNIDPKAQNSYHSVMAKNGDGVFSLLRRYRLNENSLNVQKFYSLNKLTKNEALSVNKVYILPIKIYAYNGISIRSSIGDQDWDKALRIQKYNEFLLKNKLRKTSYRTSKILWVPHHELTTNNKSVSTPKSTKRTISNNTKKEKTSKKEKVNTGTKSVNYDKLFGKKHAKYKRIDNSLRNQVYYVVSGHGGPDPGAQCLSCANTMCEDEYAYDVALRLVRNLKQHGAIVHMIIQDKNDGIRDGEHLKCDYDETCIGKTIPLDQVQRLKQRTQTINKLYAKYRKQGVKKQRAIMIHVDSNNKKHKQDTYFYYYKRSKKGEQLANHIRSTFKSKYEKHQKGRGYRGSVKARSLYMLRNTNPTAVYVELGNIRNRNDQKRLLYEGNRQALADWLYEGFIK